jgi:hypothetical protein
MSADTTTGARVPAQRERDPSAEAERTVLAVLADLREGASRGVVVDSPPGAGKSTLVVRAAREIAASGDPVMLVAQTNEQVDDLVDRIATADPSLPVGRLAPEDYRPPDRVRAHGNVRVGTKVADLGSAAVIASTSAKWSFVDRLTWRWAIIDEAYQMRSDMLLRVAPRFERGLFVGDPGQLDPFSTIEIPRWTGLTWDPMQNAVSVLLAHNPDVAQHRLPVSWRLPPSAASVVAAAFYPFTPFVAGTAPGDRRLTFATTGFGGGTVDRALETAAETGWALYELPARHTIRTDAEAVAACCALALRLLERGAVAYSPDGPPTGAPATPDRIAIGTAHRDQAAAIRAALAGRAPGITVDTANRLQGREYDVTIVLHPLSGRLDATAFHLETGRLCVLTSRHRHACIVVARAGIQELLDAHPSTEPVHLNVPVKFPDGWEANQAILTHLTPYKVRAS